MIALLRIELFGNAECEWKADERRVATDLLRLGDHVYEFMRDEWRVRLPPVATAQVWSDAAQVELDDDEESF